MNTNKKNYNLIENILAFYFFILFYGILGTISIRGADTLSVTLALSAVEELINKFLNQETGPGGGQVSPSARLSSQR